jgi:hypothetical protein
LLADAFSHGALRSYTYEKRYTFLQIGTPIATFKVGTATRPRVRYSEGKRLMDAFVLLFILFLFLTIVVRSGKDSRAKLNGKE